MIVALAGLILMDAGRTGAQDGPGLGNLDYPPDQVNKPIALLQSPGLHGYVTMHRGYLLIASGKSSGDAGDGRMSSDGYISCASCHLEGGHDGRIWDFSDRGEGLRNTISLRGRRGLGHARVHWSANFDEIQDFERDIRESFFGQGFMPDDMYERFKQPFGPQKAGLVAELDALAAFLRSLDRVGASPHKNADGSLTDDARRGKEVFGKAGCLACHAGPDFTDSTSGVVHDVGTLRPTPGGRLGESLTGIDTPTLKGLWETAPYLHDGRAATLLEIFTMHNPQDRLGSTSNLTPDELRQLVAYLLQIDDAEAPPGSGASTPAASGAPMDASSATSGHDSKDAGSASSPAPDSVVDPARMAPKHGPAPGCSFLFRADAQQAPMGAEVATPDAASPAGLAGWAGAPAPVSIGSPAPESPPLGRLPHEPAARARPNANRRRHEPAHHGTPARFTPARP
jgi:hypothetical protein